MDNLLLAVYIVMDSDRGKAFGRERKKEEAGRLGSEEVGKIKTEKIQGSKLKAQRRAIGRWRQIGIEHGA
jgi:hypothetical protein